MKRFFSLYFMMVVLNVPFLRNIGQRDLPEVPESFPEGVENEPEEEKKPERPTLKRELELTLQSKPPFAIYKLYRYMTQHIQCIECVVYCLFVCLFVCFFGLLIAEPRQREVLLQK
jgi:hypothetical protein